MVVHPHDPLILFSSGYRDEGENLGVVRSEDGGSTWKQISEGANGPLDGSAHAWHHPDSQLTDLILNGSPRNPRMIPWKEHISHRDADNIVAYLKSLWNFRNLACQGARHMRCM